MQGQTGHLAAHRIKGADEDGVRGVVHDDFNAGSSLESADVTTLTADDTALHLVVVDRESGHGILDCGLGGGALYRVDDDAFSFLGGIQTGFVHSLVDVGLGLGAGLGLHILDEHILGILGTHTGDCLKLAVGL